MTPRADYLGAILYTCGYDAERGRPKCPWAITNRPDDLMHYVMDVLARVRV